MTAASSPISLGLLKTVFTSEFTPGLFSPADTHESALRLVSQIVRHVQDAGHIRNIIAAALPEDYAGNTLDEVDEMVESALRKGFEKAGAGHGKKSRREKPDIIEIIRLAGVTLFHDRMARGFMSVPTASGTPANLLIKSAAASAWLREFWYRQTQGVLSGQSVRDLLETLEARAEFEESTEDTFLRLGGGEDLVVIDLGRADRRVVEIRPDGWEVRGQSAIRLWRSQGFGELPLPTLGNDLDRLRHLLQLEEETWHLVIGFLLNALQPTGPYCCLLVDGDQGSGKSLLCAMIKRIIDPNEADKLQLPRTGRDLMVQARQQHLLLYDNASGMRADMSDDLCKLSTGGALAVRANYTDQEQHTFKACRPFIINGIADFANRPDLMERAIVLHLRSMPKGARRTEADLWAEFEMLLPGLLGQLYTATALALRDYRKQPIDAEVRMIDAARWIMAAEPALGLEQGTILNAFIAKQDDAMAERVELDPVISFLSPFVDKNGAYENTVGRLFGIISDVIDHNDRSRPKTAAHLSAVLKRLKPAAARAGINIEFGRHRKHGRVVRIWREGKEDAKAVVPPSSEGGY